MVLLFLQRFAFPGLGRRSRLGGRTRFRLLAHLVLQLLRLAQLQAIPFDFGIHLDAGFTDDDRRRLVIAGRRVLLLLLLGGGRV